MNWKLKERDTGMYKIFEVIDEDGNNNNKNHNLIARFATDDKDYAEIKKKGQLIAAAPDLSNKFDLLGHAVVQLLNYMGMENGNIVVREHELNILENLIKEDFGHLVHGEYSNIGDDE